MIDLDRFDARINMPFATLGITADDQHVLGIRFLPASVSAKKPKPDTPAQLACAQLLSYLDNPHFRFDLPIKLTGSKHQLDVWYAMCAIAPGRTKTYGDLADAIGSNARAVGTACGRNPLPVVVPCHRVVAANGLGGFMGGKHGTSLDLKRLLLTHEGALSPRLL